MVVTTEASDNDIFRKQELNDIRKTHRVKKLHRSSKVGTALKFGELKKGE